MSGKIVDNLGRSSGLIKQGSAGANVTYETTAKSSNFTAVAGVGYFVDTSSSAITATLPASPDAGDAVAFKDYTATFATNALTLGRNSSKIQGLEKNSTIDTIRASVVLVYVDSTEGWVFVEESNVADLGIKYVTATGGTITTSGDYKVHTFTSSGTFSVSCGGSACGSNSVAYVVVAGGGAGGTGGCGVGGGGGGGGAGGYREGKASSDPYTASPLAASSNLPVSASPGSYPVTVGAGAAANGAAGTTGSTGSNSVFSPITSAGGGGGGKTNSAGGNGGSGGGNGYCGPGTGGQGNTPPVSPPQGNNGAQYTSGNGGGGGGGATAAGSTTPGVTTGGAGGAGATSSITGSPVARAGGGGGSSNSTGGSGGVGGGGDAGTGPPYVDGDASGTANTGGGGGGDYGSSGSQEGGAGGSGVVIIRYKFQN